MTRLARRLVGGAVAAILALPSVGWPQDAPWYRLIGVEGDVTLRTRYEEDDSRLGGTRSSQTQLRFEEEVNVLTHGYTVDPDFLKVDLGGGVVFEQEEFEQNTRERSSQDVRYNALAKLRFLEPTPYPLTLFFDRLTTNAAAGLADSFPVTTMRYGFDFGWREPVATIPFDLSFVRRTEEGESATTVTDESSYNLRLNVRKRSLDERWDGSLLYEFERRESASGNPEFTITPTTQTTHRVEFDANLLFGDFDQWRFKTFGFFSTQLEFPSRDDLLVAPSLDWDISDWFSAFGRYSFRQADVEGDQTTTQGARAGVRHRFYESLLSELELRGDEIRGPGLRDVKYGTAGRVSYSKRIPFGVFAADYGAIYEINDIRSGTAELSVIGEEQVLTGFLPAELRNENVVTSSVVVSNATRSRTFTEGLDYRLTVVGTRTRLERLIDGDILDGQLVVVDYRFLPPGTYEVSDLDQTYGASVDLLRRVRLFARGRSQSLRLIRGVPAQPLNPIYSELYGAQLRFPLGRWILGGEAEYEDHREVLRPFRARRFTAFVQAPLARRTSLRLSARRVLQDNFDSPEDVDLVGAGARLESYPWRRLRVTAEADYERDTGGTIDRERWIGRALAEWRIGQLTLFGEARFGHELQADSERDKLQVKLEIRREF